jgi:D-lyxose ketol-isomerase
MSDSNSAVRTQSEKLLDRANIPVTPDERASMRLVDFACGDIRRFGVQIIDIALTDLIRVAILILLPNQTLPQHRHPAYGNSPGKEETVRCVWGRFRVYLPGPERIVDGFVPPGKEQWYTARRECTLAPAQSIMIAPREPHWFQAGDTGAVAYTFQNRVDESRNQFTDPAVGAGCVAR